MRRVFRALEMPAAMSSVAVDVVFTLHRSALDRTVFSTDTPRSVRSWAWLAAIESSGNSSDQDQTTDSAVSALDKVLAQYGV